MEEIVPGDSKYIPLTQQRWCCVPTCIQMVMLRHGIPLLPAELIGYHLGLVLPEEELKYFWNGRTGERPPGGYGTQIHKKEYSPNEAFKELKIPLKMTVVLIDKFQTYEMFVEYFKKIEETDKDVLVCYDWGKLFDENYQGGHLCVLDKIYLEKNEIRIIDPEYQAKKWIVVKIDKLYESMKFHGPDKVAGFWELELTK